jgi:hypothetical protein
MSELTPSPKSGWSRPENYTQWIPVIALGAAGFYFLDKILPFVQSVLENLLYTGVLGIGVALMVGLVMSKDLHRLGYSYYRSAIRWLTNLVVRIDPISILRDGIRRVKQNLENMSASEAELASQERSLEQLIASNTKEYGKEMTYQGLLNRIKAYRAITARVRAGAEIVAADTRLRRARQPMTSIFEKAADDVARTVDGQLIDEAVNDEVLGPLLSSMVCLVYLGEKSALMAEHVPARVVKLHPSQDITFCVTDPGWKARLGWGPSAHVELQVRSHPEKWIVDHFCWHEVQGPPEWEL